MKELREIFIIAVCRIYRGIWLPLGFSNEGMGKEFSAFIITKNYETFLENLYPIVSL